MTQNNGNTLHSTNSKPWHAIKPSEVYKALDTAENGLSETEAEARFAEVGPNVLQTRKRTGPLRRLLKQFHNVLIYILLVAAILTAWLQEWIDMSVILGVVVVNAVIGFLQEGKAERAMEAIRNMLSPTTTVERGGEKREIEAEALVPGDLVHLRSGDKVPADLRVMDASNAQVDEAILTGESTPVKKASDPVSEDEALGDRQSMTYAGTVVTSGSIQGIVVATGQNTEIGRISEMVSHVETLQTPLLRRIDTFGRYLAAAILGLSAVVFGIGYFLLDQPPVDLFLAIISLAVAAIPEGLPAIMTVTLALGVQRMAKRNAIVRKLPAVETLGSVTVVCADKTGTLTRNEMTVTEVVLPDKQYTVTGTGYEPKGTFRVDDKEISPEDDTHLLRLLRSGLLASEARLRQEDDRWLIEGGPTEGGLVVLAGKAGLTREEIEDQNAQIAHLPFESDRKYAASLTHTDGHDRYIHVNGAPERVLELCSTVADAKQSNSLDEEQWLERARDLASEGLRVLAIAGREASGDDLQENDIQDLTLLGLVGMLDPPREEAIEAIQKCHDAGIRVKMITGDHLLTARSIGKRMGIGDGENATAGKDLEGLEGEKLADMIEDDDVFARSSPEHKLKIVEALQGRKQIVAMTGDGVNDAPSLKRADVGVAMGINGSEAAKEAAEIVLADDNFATIERAVEEGRTIYDNLIKTILFLLPTNGAQSLVVIASVLFFFETMLTTPVQILWVNMVTAVTLALALAFELPENNIMRRPPRPPEEPILTTFLLWRIASVSMLIGAAAVGMFLYYRERVPMETARTIVINTIVSCQVFYLISSRYFEDNSFSLAGFIENRKILVAIAVLALLQVVFTYWPYAQTLFDTQPLTVGHWLCVFLAGVVVFIVVETEKALFRLYHRKTS